MYTVLLPSLSVFISNLSPGVPITLFMYATSLFYNLLILEKTFQGVFCNFSKGG